MLCARLLITIVGLLALVPSLSAAPEATELPRVLIIGDSISLGYTPFVQSQLKDQAVVTHNPGNGRYAAYGLANLDQWLGDEKWDVIHFNWGLWDLCYRHPDSKVQGNRDKVNGKLTATPEDYHRDMTAIVERLKKTGAKLIWCATTPVPGEEAGRIQGDEIKYNAIAAEIMKTHGVTINDLHSHALEVLPKEYVGAGNVHFTKAGSEHLAKQVTTAIEQAIELRKEE